MKTFVQSAACQIKLARDQINVIMNVTSLTVKDINTQFITTFIAVTT